MAADDARPSLNRLLFTSLPFLFGMFFVVAGFVPLTFFLITGKAIFEPDKALTPGTWAYQQAQETVIVLAIMFPVLGGAAALYGWVKSKRLAAHGVIVLGTVYEIGKFQYRGMKNISYSYSCDGQKVEGRASVDVSAAEQYRGSPEIKLLVDPKRPKVHIRL